MENSSHRGQKSPSKFYHIRCSSLFVRHRMKHWKRKKERKKSIIMVRLKRLKRIHRALKKQSKGKFEIPDHIFLSLLFSDTFEKKK